jgi:hypothetical protein
MEEYATIRKASAQRSFLLVDSETSARRIGLLVEGEKDISDN